NWAVNRVFVQRERNDRYNQFVVNRDKPYSAWRIVPLSQAFASEMNMEISQLKKQLPDFDQKLDEFVMANADRVAQLARPNYAGVSKDAKVLIDKSKKDPKKIYHLAREGYSDMYFLRGERIIFFRDTLKEVDGELVPGEPLTTLWDDIPSHNLHNEGGVDFPKSKKPEALIKRCLELTTDLGEIVLDSFAGSGTTGAVAHKMGRRWVMVELGDHAQSHCVPRMKKVISNKDESGVSKAVNWKGGGGFKFYTLAPSLLRKDSFGNWVIDENYNPDMLAGAMAKHENYKYSPSETIFWKHGQSTEKDFIYTTTQFVTKELIDKIHEQMQAEESLLICCKSFQAGCTDGYPNINVKKIPNMLLGRCEFGREDYSLNIINLPHDDDASSQDEPEAKAKIDKHKAKIKKPAKDQSSLFSENEE
ncbi:MAG TPA: site-specific DNA-methyltransferase, partial [Pseudobdellovibrionaceae bacterium]|nr:site-specific DNA-methyltransferase [Pseudobdellovibrionaceae bacterium]